MGQNHKASNLDGNFGGTGSRIHGVHHMPSLSIGSDRTGHQLWPLRLQEDWLPEAMVASQS